MRRRRSLLGFAVLTPGIVVAGCFAFGEGVLPKPHRVSTDGGVSGRVFDASLGGPSQSFDAASLAPAPHSVISVDPAHGPFDGGNRAIVRGTGFTSDVRVWFGATEAAKEGIVPVDPNHVQVTVPKGTAGVVDVATQNGDDPSTRSVLDQGYVYDSFYLNPSTGPVSGGTLVTLYGDGTSWDLSTRVLVDQSRCAVVAVRHPANQPEELDCRTPPGTQGSKAVRILGDAGSAEVLDGFLYADSANGFSGGLSGGPLGTTLHVLALNSITGTALPSATVILGGDATAAATKTADANGVVVVTGPSIGPKQTVTIAAHCFQPTTFVDVPVDTVTAYLDPVLSPDCINLGHPTGIGQGGGSTQIGANVQGEIVWPSSGEFQRGPFNVPVPSNFEPDASSPKRVAAYVFELSSSATSTFRLPARKSGITPLTVGKLGYSFSLVTDIGNLSLYALAGVEDRTVSPPLFTAYTMGIVSGVTTTPGVTTSDVYIQMDVPLDHAIDLTVDGPAPTSRGPDHVKGKVGVRLGTRGYVILPVSTQTALLPGPASLSFVGFPPLVSSLSGGSYVTTATAATGPNDSTPLSVVGLVGTTTTSTPVTLDGFLEVPRLTAPTAAAEWDGQSLDVSSVPGGPSPDLSLFEIDSGGGLSTWTVVAPGNSTTVRLPDLSSVPSLAGPSGTVTITVTLAKIDAFTYGKFAYSNLTSRTWSAYAEDVFQAHR